jgi:hypothetical protein
MKIIFKIFLLILINGQVFGQSESTSIYKNLKTKKYYPLGLSSRLIGDEVVYKVNGETVDKKTYEKFHSTYKNMENCCPCILKAYDENEILLREAVSCTDCWVGYLKEYHPNGNLKLIGFHKENPTKNWKNIWDRGFCNVKDGKWTYFNEDGDTLYSEYWTNGEFIKQVPEQPTMEIWEVELFLNGQAVNEQTINLEQISNLEIKPKYKNTNTDSKLIINFQVSAIGHKQNEKTFSIERFKDINVINMLSEVGIPDEKETSFVLAVFNYNSLIKRFYLNVKK